MANGHFITFEGVEGAGKTSVISLVEQELTKLGYSCIVTREPGGIKISEKIRTLILDKEHTEMDGRTEALLYAAARRQHIVERIAPALEKGEIVLCDRFIDSSLAYQGFARGLGIKEVYNINAFAINDCMPELTILFKIDPKQGLARIAANKSREVNRLDMEALDFHMKVAEGYEIVEQKFPKRISAVDASELLNEVVESTLAHVLNKIQGEPGSK